MIYVHSHSMNYLTKNLWRSSLPSIDLVTILVRNVLAGAGLVHVQLFYPVLRSSEYQMRSSCLQWAFSGHQIHQFFRHLRTLRVARFKHCGRPVHLRISKDFGKITEVWESIVCFNIYYMEHISWAISTRCWSWNRWQWSADSAQQSAQWRTESSPHGSTLVLNCAEDSEQCYHYMPLSSNISKLVNTL